jgi:REP element-mobilizing transposase RayT
MVGYDYNQLGAYFITTCTYRKACIFGGVRDGEMALNPSGKIVLECWLDLPNHYPNLAPGEFVVMPNHVHGIIIIHEIVGTGLALSNGMVRESSSSDSPRAVPTGQTLSSIIGRFKSVSTIKVNKALNTPGASVWQRLRNETEWARAREYILSNPLNWRLDEENPAVVRK